MDALNQKQLTIIQDVLDAIESSQIPIKEVEDAIIALEHVIIEVQHQHPHCSGLTENVIQTAEKHNVEKKDFSKAATDHNLKITIPIIPFILSYEGQT
jgi:hypothetical protein